ncbi:PREDICTED: ankyrin repeat domain-containing protein 60 [Gavialis gangeticus]|uniref:ankyrin repeat domain-containing protein 60 n=1 Tax=Gavialis gangeticus TaxID=94835 RepID=UPI00092EBEF1|nr:PREDICTED: ankyrin repeat domain-containing protein 60 [Gavialis gangeticus]
MWPRSRFTAPSKKERTSKAAPGNSSAAPTVSLPAQFTVQLHLPETNETFSLPDCHNDLTIQKLKDHLELLAGIPLDFQRLQYLDEIDLPDDSTFKSHDIVPGGTITLRIWQHDGLGHLVAAAAEGNIPKLISAGVTKDPVGRTPQSDFLGPEQEADWRAHRTFVALYIASHRGHAAAVHFLLENGADVHFKTPLGRTALHVAAIKGHYDCIDELLTYGAQAATPDNEGQTAMSLARLWGQKQSERLRIPLLQQLHENGRPHILHLAMARIDVKDGATGILLSFKDESVVSDACQQGKKIH